MKPASAKPQEWLLRKERGSVTAIRVMAFVALKLGRPFARLLLYPICIYFMIFSGASRRSSLAYLARALGRRPGPADRFRHYHTFACCVLDRVYLLNDQIDMFELNIEGEEMLQGGSLLFGAHLGSFEVLRAIGRRRNDINVTLTMYGENARKINSVLNAINPKLAMDVIELGRPTSMLEIGYKLQDGHFVGVMGDRSLKDEDQVTLPFFGAGAPFPIGPFRMATILKRPVMLMVGLYRGGLRYDIHFEKLFDPADYARDERDKAIAEAMTRYAARIEHYCKSAPYNWFNFYDFWK